MDESLERIICQALEEARAKGRDRLTQTTLAVRAACQTQPELTASEAAAIVRKLQRTMRSPLASILLLILTTPFEATTIEGTARVIEGAVRLYDKVPSRYGQVVD